MIIESLKARFVILGVAITIALTYFLPNFIPLEKYTWWPAKNKLVYGLDIQGGLHLVLAANVDTLIQERLSLLGFEIQEKLNKQGIELKDLKSSLEKPFFLSLQFKSPEDATKTQEWIQANFTTVLKITKNTEDSLKLSYYKHYINDLKKQAVQQSIEVIRRRIDEFGVSEPLIQAQGEDRILVQLPGFEDSKKAKRLIQQTARLELAIVNENFPVEKLIPMIKEAEKSGGYSLEESNISYTQYVARINKDLKQKLPENSRLVFENAPNALSLKAGKIPYLVDMNQSIQGGLLENANMAFDPDTNVPLVTFSFRPEGRKQFSTLTAKSIGKKLAVILDNVVKSAPVVQSRIPGDGQISLGSGGNYEELLEEAKRISITLRAGALPTQLHQLEEKTVGPTLGKHFIEKGKMAGMIGLFLVLIFMLIYYKTLGLIANISLMANMFFLLSIMSSLSAVLTLPGIAGIILTIGMAVDANVIIFERIKEELKKGASLKLAVRDGFGHAFSAILDANITTAIVCFVLIYFSTGSVRGFALTLFIGILSSLWTAIFLSRTLLDFCILRFNWKKL